MAYDTTTFFEEDYPRTLFPLETNKILIENGATEIESYISNCLNAKKPEYSFLPQQRVFADKPNRHLRRTVKLDPVAEYFIYDVVRRNRKLFLGPKNLARSHFGYRFEGGKPITAASSYEGFKKAIAKFSKEYPHYVSFDISAYFNSIYHHDIVAWFDTLGANTADVNGLGQFLRETNSGRSVDCLPHGLYPTKMIGNDFIRFVDESHRIKSDQLLRFMDDFYIFSNKQESVFADFQSIQRMIGEKGLNINPKKTSFDGSSHVKLDSEVEKIKIDLLRRRRLIITKGYDEDAETITKLFKMPLNKKELDYITSLLNNDVLDEEDAELVLTLMRNHAAAVDSKLKYIIESFPHLAKNVYLFTQASKDKEKIADILFDIVDEDKHLSEYQLFWMGKILEDQLLDCKKASDLIDRFMTHANATPISKAKILEIADNRYGLSELRSEFLKTGEASWLSWSSAVGSRANTPLARNHILAYFAKSSNMNKLVSEIVKTLPKN